MKSCQGFFRYLPSGSQLLAGLLRWVPVILWATGIFIFSSRRYPLGAISHSSQRRPIGQLAHIGEYAGLAALLYRALAAERRESQTFWIALGGTFSYAVLDEIHQGFVPGRICSLLDVGFDLVGALVALGLIQAGQYMSNEVNAGGKGR